MYDLLGGGFARYSVDEEWRIPHFEKMLYDNAQLVPLYIDVWKQTKQPHYRRIAEETLEYVLREMTLPNGGFCASQDADSEGEEGKYFVWTPQELKDILGEERGRQVALWLQVTESGTFEHGTSVLRLEAPLETLPEKQRQVLLESFERLLAVRKQRIAPGRDDKIVTAWNGLMLSAFARAGAALQEERYLEAARRGADCLLTTLTHEGRLYRSWKDERLGTLGFLDDYANTAMALLDLYEATLAPRWLEESLRLSEEMVTLFWDEDEGGFFYNGHDAEALVVRSKKLIGGAVPSGNGVAALLFAKLATLCGREELGEKADRLLRSYESFLVRGARALGEEAIAGAWRTGSVLEIGVAGEAGDLLQECRRRFLPFAIVGHAEHHELLPWMKGREASNGQETVFLCERGACRLPVQTLEALQEQLEELTEPAAGQREFSSVLIKGRVRAPALPDDPAVWLNTSRSWTLERLKGQVVVLDFWTYCCINCLHVLPVLSAIEEEFAGESVVVLGVHSPKFTTEKGMESVRHAVRRHQLHHPVVQDAELHLWKQYAIRSWPTVLVLDPEGRIAWQQSGEVSHDTLREVIQALLKESREKNTLESPAWSASSKTEHTAELRHPGKVKVWPAPSMTENTGSWDKSRLYVADTGNHRILELALEEDGEDVHGRVLRCWGDGKPGLVDGSAPRFRFPQGMSRQGEKLWVADTENHALRCIELTSGEVKTIAGTGVLGRNARFDPALPREMDLRSPWDVLAVDEMVLVAMAGTHQIWTYAQQQDRFFPIVGTGAENHADGAPSEAALAQPSALYTIGPYLFWADSEISSIRYLNFKTNQVGTMVGHGLFDFGDVDGSGAEVLLQHPLGLTGSGDALYIADTFNHKIKRLDLAASEVHTLAGGGGEMNEPGGLTVIGSWLIVADTNHHRLLRVHRQTGEVRELKLLDVPSVGGES
jgi:thiol-disulfide isomerase/thioredoxin